MLLSTLPDSGIARQVGAVKNRRFDSSRHDEGALCTKVFEAVEVGVSENKIFIVYGYRPLCSHPDA